MGILAESTLTSQAKITVPKVVRQLLDVHAGDCLIWSLDSQGHLVVSGRRQHTLTEIRAAVAAAGPLTAPAHATVQDMKAGIATTMRKKHGRG